MTVHQDQPVFVLGADLPSARSAVVLFHGRGATADSMYPFVENLHVEGARFYVPQAALNRWYPNTAFGPLEDNQPDLDSALSLIDDLIAEIQESGLPWERILLGGFSQGACLAAEYAARNPGTYGGVFALSGALIGPPGPRQIPAGSLSGTPVIISGSDNDPWVSTDLMAEAADYFRQIGAGVDYHIFPGKGHAIIPEEMDLVRSMIQDASRRIKISG